MEYTSGCSCVTPTANDNQCFISYTYIKIHVRITNVINCAYAETPVNSVIISTTYAEVPLLTLYTLLILEQAGMGMKLFSLKCVQANLEPNPVPPQADTCGGQYFPNSGLCKHHGRHGAWPFLWFKKQRQVN